MNPEQWERAKVLFESALDRPACDRAQFLTDNCATADLRKEVERLLEQHERAGGLLDSAPVRSGRTLSVAPGEVVGRIPLPQLPHLRAGIVLASRFKIARFVARGGMGEVYEAEDLELTERVAVKAIREDLLTDSTALQRFRREVHCARKVTHPNVCRIFDLFRHQVGDDQKSDILLVSMEFLEGPTLAQLIAAHGPLPYRDAIPLFQQMAAGLQAAHDSGVIHRDFKPGNVMLVPVGDRTRAVVTDFGLASRTDAEGGSHARNALTGSHGIVGTIAYMSPEQALGLRLDARTDVFSFGVVLYEVITGALPFTGDSHTEVSDSSLHPSGTGLVRFNAAIPPALTKIIDKCLKSDRKLRYQTMAEVSADLERLSSGTGRGGAAATMAAARRWSPARGWAALIVIAVLALLGAVGTRKYLNSRNQIHSIAVLPLEDLSHDSEREYFADGMTDELITELAQIGSLRVISRTSVMHYKATHKALPEITRELGVDAVVEGTVERSADRVRINAQLIQAGTDSHLWARSYERSLSDVLELQTLVARQIVSEIKIKLVPEEQMRLASARAVNPQAYEAYLKGRYYWNKRTAGDMKKSLAYFQQAISEDPNYAPGYAGLADAYLILGAGQYGSMAPAEAMAKAEAAARRAIQLDDRLAEAHATLGYVKAGYYWDWKGGEQEFQRALELNPNYATAHQWYGLWAGLLSTKRDLAVDELRTAERLDPLSLIISADVAFQLYLDRRYDKAIEQLRKTLEMDPDFATAHAVLAAVYKRQGKHQQAIAESERALLLSGGNLFWKAELAEAYALAGRSGDALKLTRELSDTSKKTYVPALAFVYIYTALGDKDQALLWLERAYAAHEDILCVGKDAAMDPLRSDPRFESIVRRAGLNSPTSIN